MGVTTLPTTSRQRSRASRRDAARRSRFRMMTRKSSSPSSSSRTAPAPTKRRWIELDVVKRKVTSAISNLHGLSVADLVVVAPGSIPITTSGKVRRAACVERYRQNQFARLDA